MRRACGLCALFALFLGCTTLAHAQDAAPRARSFELSAGGVMLGGVDFGHQNATLTGNDPGNPDFILFATSSKIKASAGLDARATFNVTRTFALEGVFTWTRATAETDITSDAEGVPNTTLKEDLSTYFIEGAAVVHLRGLQFAGGRGLPFVFGGGGYLRQLDGSSILVDTGTVFHAGGGIKYFFAQRSRGFVHDIGIRADGRIYVRSGGLELVEDKTRRPTWGLAGGLVVRF
jgi:hypothetical protein